jgi:hypothetical protein
MARGAHEPYRLTLTQHLVDAGIGLLLGFFLGVAAWLLTLWWMFLP